MLNVPNNIKSLFKRDGVRKNFRVHFPNGEHSDITNDNILTETVSFTESAMSQNIFTFGTAERAVIEFETVNIPNIYGYTIECGIEIDTSSLSAAQLSAIFSNPGDGVLVPQNDSDIGFGYYRIPYGVFRVVSCPRNQENMARRQVRALSFAFDSPLEDAKLTSLIDYRRYTTDLRRTGAAVLGYWDSTVPERLMGYSRSTYKTWAQIQAAESELTGTTNGYINGQSATIKVTRTVSTFQPIPNTNILLVERTGKWADVSLFNKFCADLANLGFTFANLTPGWTQEQELTSWRKRFQTTYYTDGYSGYTINPNDCYGFPADGSFVLDARYRISSDIASQSASLSLVRKVSYEITVGGDVIASGNDNSGNDQEANIYELTYSGSDPSASIQVSESYKTSAPGTDAYQHVGLDMVSVGTSWAELNALVITSSRGKKYRAIRLDNSSPVSIGPGDFASLWWDEYDILPITSILYMAGKTSSLSDYKLTSGTNALPVGGSEYDFRGNVISQSITNPSRSTVLSLINAYLLPNADSANFTPVTMKMKGWPWIEAGDALEITTESGEVINTYALRRTLTGVQLLMDDIESPGGQVLEE